MWHRKENIYKRTTNKEFLEINEFTYTGVCECVCVRCTHGGWKTASEIQLSLSTMWISGTECWTDSVLSTFSFLAILSGLGTQFQYQGGLNSCTMPTWPKPKSSERRQAQLRHCLHKMQPRPACRAVSQSAQRCDPLMQLLRLWWLPTP